MPCFGRPSRRFEAPVCGGRLLNGGLAADAIDTTRLAEAAAAIGDGSEHARRFEFNATTAIHIDANAVSIIQETNDA